MKKQQFRAQTMVEFALIFPIAIFLILGFFDLGRAVFNFAALSNAVREGTRYAIANNDAVNSAAMAAGYPALKQKVYDYSFAIPPADIAVTVNITMQLDPWGNVSQTRDKISITATYTFVPVTPGIKQILGDGNGIPITAQSTMRLEPISRDD
ncbi:MAG: TadE/TadG family type IV pilus assembly protein [Anaerolineaceae bacterium]